MNFRKLIIKYFFLLLIFILCGYMLKNNLFNFKKMMFKENFDYSYFRSKTNFLIGKIINNKESLVTSTKFEYKSKEKFGNSTKFITDPYYVVESIQSGIITYIGEKENLGHTVIINGDDGVNYWYSNIENISLSLYDYIDELKPIGTVVDGSFYLTLTKDNNYLDYETYKN